MSARRAFPHTRMRRLRASAFARDMVRESTLSPANFIYPVFVLDHHCSLLMFFHEPKLPYRSGC